MIYYWNNARRFNAYSDYIKTTFGGRVQKVSVNAGFTCPNRDGSISSTGCSYCNNKGFSPSYCNPEESLTYQIDEGIKFLSKRYKPLKYIAYFQAYTNTYGSIDDLRKLYMEALSHPAIDGLSIGTRPDCIDAEKLELLTELAKTYYINIEFGIESCYNATLRAINRGHSFEQTVTALEATFNRGIHVGGHLIFGLPGETKQMMLDEAKVISHLPLNSIKFHQLQILRDTPIADLYQKDPSLFSLFSLDEYIDFVIEFVEHLNPAIIIERFTSESPPTIRLAPDWGSQRLDVILLKIENRMKELNTWQGKKF